MVDLSTLKICCALWRTVIGFLRHPSWCGTEPTAARASYGRSASKRSRPRCVRRSAYTQSAPSTKRTVSTGSRQLLALMVSLSSYPGNVLHGRGRKVGATLAYRSRPAGPEDYWQRQTTRLPQP